MRALIASVCFAAFIMGMMVLGRIQWVLVTEECNDRGGVFIDGYCQVANPHVNKSDESR